MFIIGTPTDKRVWYFLNHCYQRVGRCDLLNHHEWRECNDQIQHTDQRVDWSDSGNISQVYGGISF